MIDQKTRLSLAVRVNEAEGCGIVKAAAMVGHVCAYGPASPHWDLVLPHVRDFFNELMSIVRPLARAIDEGITAEAREGIRQHEQGRRMMARHPDLARLDRYLNDMYGMP